MTIRMKRSAFPQGVSGEILLAILVAEEYYDALGLELTITSLNDSMHKVGSRHYPDDSGKCHAVDLRTKNIPRGQVENLVNAIRDALPDCYDVILEGLGTANEHVHLEFDPKTNPPGINLA